MLPASSARAIVPVPAMPLLYPRLGTRRVLRIQRVRGPLERDILLKRSLGYPDDTLTRAESVLANLGHWNTPAQ